MLGRAGYFEALKQQQNNLISHYDALWYVYGWSTAASQNAILWAQAGTYAAAFQDRANIFK